MTRPRPGSDRVSEPDWQRRRRLAEVFGDAEPERSTDDAGDRWLREQVPPHHGG